MAVKAWLIGGVITDDRIAPEKVSCWERKDLVDVPAMIQYSDDFDKAENIHVFSNNIGCRVVLLPYGEFESREALWQDYYYGSDAEECLYDEAYAKAVAAVERQIGESLRDLDWVMPILQGETEIESNYCCIRDFSAENKELVCLVDCSVIYSSVRMIGSFVSALCEKKALSKYEQYQLAYYQMILQSIERPGLFLTNKEETELYLRLYDAWNIAGSIENATGNAKQAVMLFSFLSSYQSAHENELFSSFLTFFGIVVGLEAIYNLSVALMGGASRLYNIGFTVALVAIIGAYAVVFCRKLGKKMAESREFREKTAAGETKKK